jgi:hypothetical protein
VLFFSVFAKLQPVSLAQIEHPLGRLCGVCIPEAFMGRVLNDHRESMDLSFFPKFLPYNSFADPHPLTSIKSYLYKDMGGGGYSSFAKSFLCRKSFPCHTSEIPLVGFQPTALQRSCLKISPSFMTNFTFSRTRMSSSGFPETATMSAYFPGRREPSKLDLPSRSAALLVAD